MQEQTFEGKYLKPEDFNPEKIVKELAKPTASKFIVYQSLDEAGRPTKEQRRAWRRHNRTSK